MKNVHIVFCKGKLLFVQYVEVFHANVILFVEETLLLNTGHVKDIKIRDGILKTLFLYELDVVFLQHVLTDVAWDAKLFR